MFRTVLGIGFGIATVAGGIYLYRKYGGGKRKGLVAHVAGVVVGDKVGTLIGHSIAGNPGAIIGSVLGAVSGVITAEKYLLPPGDKPELLLS